MERIYAENPDICKLVKAKPETVAFLLNYSKSLHVAKHKGIKFESNLN